MRIPILSSLLSRKPGPPPAFRSQESLGADQNLRWNEAHPAMAIAHPSVERVGSETIDWPSLGAAQLPAAGVLELRDNYSLTGAGWAIGRDGVAIADTTWYGSAHAEIKTGLRRSRPRRIRGTALSLLSDFAQINYYHFRIDALARYALFEALATTLPKPDVVLCPRPFSKRLERWIEMLELRDVEIRLLDREERVRADCLLVPSFPGVRRQTTPWAVEFWRRRSRLVAQAAERKLYLPRRSTTRTIKNEAELEAALSARGFEVIDPADLAKPEETFAQASIVIGAHGAALTDAMFCRPGAVMVEIVPSDHVFPYYYFLAGAAQLRYAYIVARSDGQRPPGALGPSPFDMTVDVAALVEWLDRRAPSAAL